MSELRASTLSTRPPVKEADAYNNDATMEDGTSAVVTETVDVFEDTEMSIPSESLVQNAKQKRDRIRKTAAAGEQDYISLSVTRRGDEPSGPHPGSRLVREEDELGEGDDGPEFPFTLYRRNNEAFNRVCGIHKRSREDCARQEI